MEEPDGVEEVCLGVGDAKAYRRDAKWHVACVLGGTPCTLLVDTGCPTTLINPRVAQQLPGAVRRGLRPMARAFRGVAGHPVDVRGEIPLRVELGPHRVDAVVIVAEMVHDGILGLETLTALGVALDFAAGTLSVSRGLVTTEETWCTIEAAERVVVPPRAEQLVVGRARVEQGIVPEVGLWRPEPANETIGQLWVPVALVKVDNREVRTTMVNPTDETIVINQGGTLGFLQPIRQVTEAVTTGEIVAPISEGERTSGPLVERGALPTYLTDMIVGLESRLDRQQCTSVTDVLREYQDVFRGPHESPGRTSTVRHHIETGNERPVKQTQQRTVEEAVSRMKTAGMIRESESPWSSPMVVVTRLDGTTHFCVDYRKLNEATPDGEEY